MKATKEIDIYLIRKRNVRTIDVVQYDTGVQLVFTVKDFTIPSGATAALYVQKPSGKFVLQEDGISVAGNIITVNLENQAITEHGKAPYQVSLKSGSDVITTFTGLMMVEKSLKDAGTTESKTVIRAFDQAVSDHVAEFQAKAEQIVQACIATIPDDYTTMEAKVNELANAVKGYLSGAVVFADDVSPVEHSPAVRVHGKNLFDTSKIAVQANTDNIYISAVGEGYIDITTKESYDGNGHCVTWIKLKELCPQMQAGKQYALSGTTTAWNKMIYLKEIDLFWSYGTRQIVTEEMLECTIGFYGLNSIREQGFGTCRISNIQCEEGYDITEYTPYIDPSTVTVRRCGKNIFGVAAKSQTINGVTFTVNADGSVTANGTATKATFIGLGSLVLKPDEKYRLSGSPAGSGFDTYLLYIHNNTTGADIYDLGEGKVFTGKEGDLGVTIAVYAGNTVNNLIFRPMVVYGEESGTFEPYNGTSYIPAADGTIPDLTSLSPNMTILTDTEGVIVECEYNRDTNKVIDKLINAITAIGGTV